MIKILQLGKFFPVSGGVEKVMYDLIEGLTSEGVACDMLCTNAEPGVPYREFDVNGCGKVMCTKALTKSCATMVSPSLICKLRGICHDYDIIHVHHPDPMAALALRMSGYDGKVVLHWHSDIKKQEYILRLYKPLQDWLLNRADVVVGTTPVYIPQSPHAGAYVDKSTYMPIGIDALKPEVAKVQGIRSRYRGKKIVFSLGRLVHYKGYKYLIDAARFLTDDYVVLIGGTGKLRDQLQTQIDDSRMQGRVIMLGRLSDEDLPNYFGACDVYCLSSIMKTEAFGIVQIEAMSCGKPVIATDIPASGVPWVNVDGVSGLNVPVMDGHAIADAIIRITTNSTLYSRLAAGAQERFNSLFRKETMITRCKEIYSGL